MSQINLLGRNYSEAVQAIKSNFSGKVKVEIRCDGIIVKQNKVRYFVDLNGEMKVLF